MKASYKILFGIIVLASGCTTIQDDVKNRREATIASCVRQVEISRAIFKEDAIAYMGVSRERLPGVLCNRLADGVASGRINQSDLNGLIRTGLFTDRFRFLKVK